MDTVDKVLKIAESEVGYLEKSAVAYKQYGASCLYYKTSYAGSDNYTKYGYEMHQLSKVMDFPAAWCDCFVDWCFYKAYGEKNAKKLLGGSFDDYTKGSTNLYIKEERFYYAKAGAKPKAGDQVFFSKNGTFAGIYHTGLVVSVDDKRVYTIEGNTSTEVGVVPNGGGVCKKSYLLTDSKIYGYGRPDYDVEGWHWVYDGSRWFYQDESGKNSYGWMRINETESEYSHWYYFGKDGAMLKGLQKLPYTKDGKGTEGLFYLAESGVLEGAMCSTDNDGALGVMYAAKI